MIRRATLDDIPTLCDIGRKFTAAATLPFDEAAVVESMQRLLQSDDAVVFMFEDGSGVLGGLTYRGFFSGQVIAQELFWWCEKEGLRLLGEFEKWAKQKGAKDVVMVCLEALAPDRVGSIYRRRGYAPLEHSFVRTL